MAVRTRASAELAGASDSGGASQFVIEPSRGWTSLRLSDIWVYRELLFFLGWRDIKVRYKQAALGVTWVLLQPVLAVAIFTAIFGWLLKVPSGETPYPVFAYSALLPWNYFAGALTRSSTSLVGSANLITKVYFPRLIIPLAAILAGLVDLGIGFLVLVILMVCYGIAPTLAVVLLPLFVILATLTALAFGMWLSALNVRYRDINHIVPFLVQVWMYATPVIYDAGMIPERFRFLLGLNPMTAVIEGFRWALLGAGFVPDQASGWVYLLSIIVLGVVLVTGLVYFRSTERTFADII
jgi:lipopolysaccharide transport system permease protein